MNGIEYDRDLNFLAYPFDLALQHFYAIQSCEWGGREVCHLFLGIVELIPLLGIIAALFERQVAAWSGDSLVVLHETTPLSSPSSFLVLNVKEGDPPIKVDQLSDSSNEEITSSP